jgi:hypothetical protein
MRGVGSNTLEQERTQETEHCSPEGVDSQNRTRDRLDSLVTLKFPQLELADSLIQSRSRDFERRELLEPRFNEKVTARRSASDDKKGAVVTA